MVALLVECTCYNVPLMFLNILHFTFFCVLRKQIIVISPIFMTETEKKAEDAHEYRVSLRHFISLQGSLKPEARRQGTYSTTVTSHKTLQILFFLIYLFIV